MRSPASTPAPSREDQVALFALSFITEPQMHLPSKPTSRDRDKSHPSLQDLLIHLSSLVAHPTAVSRPCLLKGCLDGILDFLQLGLRINVAITILDSNTHTQAYTGTYTRTHNCKVQPILLQPLLPNPNLLGVDQSSVYFHFKPTSDPRCRLPRL